MLARFDATNRISRLLAVAIPLALAACSDSSSGPSRRTSDLAVDSPGAEAAVGTLDTEGEVTVRGRVIRVANLERLAYTLDQDAEVDVDVDRSEAEGSFDFDVSALALGAHVITLRAYDRDGTSHAAPGITVHVVPVLREIPMPSSAVDAFPLAINEHGDVVGHWREAAAPTWHAFHYRNGQMTELGAAGEWRSAASDVNEGGEIAGYMVGDVQVGEPHAVVWRGGEAQSLLDRPGTADAINDVGSVTGSIVGDDDLPRAYVMRNGQLIVFGEAGRISTGVSINSGGKVVGTSYARDGSTFAFVHFADQTEQLDDLGGTRTYAQAINDAGTVVGYGENAARNALRAFVHQGGETEEVRSVGARDLAAFPFAINNRGVVVGEMVENRAGFPDHWGFVYTGQNLVALDDILGLESHAIISAYGVSDRGEIVAVAIALNDPAFTLRPVLIALPGGLGAAADVLAGASAAPRRSALRSPALARRIEQLRTRRGAGARETIPAIEHPFAPLLRR